MSSSSSSGSETTATGSSSLSDSYSSDGTSSGASGESHGVIMSRLSSGQVSRSRPSRHGNHRNSSSAMDPDALGFRVSSAAHADVFAHAAPDQTRGKKLMQSLQGFLFGDNDDETDLDAAAMEAGVNEELENRRWDNSGAFAVLPDEMVAQIFDWLEVQALGRMAQTCWRMNRISEDVPMLAGKARRGKWLQPGVLPKNTLAFYKDSFKNFKARERSAAMSQRLAALSSEKYRTQRRARRTFVALFGLVAELFSILTIWVCLVRGVLLLDGLIETTWDTVFMPLLVPALQLAFGNYLFGCMIFAVNYTDLDADDLRPRAFCSPGLFYFLFVAPVRNELGPAGYAMLLPTGVASVFLIVKLSYFLTAAEFPFVVCGAPLVLQMLVVAGAHVLGAQTPLDDSQSSVERFVVVVLALLWASAVLLLSLKLDGYVDVGWYETLIPMFLTFAWPAFYSLWAPVLSVLPCTESCMNDKSRWNEYDKPCEHCYMSLPLNATLGVPLLTFVALVATNLEYDRFDSYSAQFAPIFCICVVATLLWIWGRIAMM